VVRSILTATLLAIAALAPPAAAAPSGDTASGLDLGSHKGQVTARLLADVVDIAPGQPFRLGVEITMQPGWHTYWENGGDAGLPTTIDWELPEGFSAGPILWPVPHRYEEEENLVTFGYADRVILLTEVTPPGTLPEGPFRIQGAVEWLQCKDICVPGGEDLDLTLGRADQPVPAPDPVLRAFAAAAGQLPADAAEASNLGVQVFQSLDAVPPGESAEVAVVFSGAGNADPAESGFFPRPSDTLWMRDGAFHRAGDDLALIIPVEVDTAVDPGAVVPLPGVVRLVRPEGDILVSFEVPVTVADAGQAGVPTDAPVFSARGSSAGGGAAEATGPGLLRYLIMAFFGGMILNVMPCVLPVISLKILGFVSQAEEDPKKIARLGWMFAAGVVFSFLVLAAFVIGLKSAGEHIGWGFQFQNPIFVGALTVVVFVFSLTLLGVFEMTALAGLPGWSIISFAAKERKDYADAFFHGILTTILATPCTAPMLGAAVAFAFVQPAPVILLVFLTVAAGLAAPYVMLSLNPGWLKYLPRPGMWMERFKQGMGFLLLATMVWLLFVFGAQVGIDGLGWMLAFLLVIGFFAWVHGTFMTMSSSRTQMVVIWLLTVLGIGGAYRGLLHEHLFQPAEARAAGLAAGIGPKVEVTKGGVRWEPFSTGYLESSVSAGRTVFLDFTADWCWTCKVNEKTVLADGDVERVFHENRVLTLKGDWTLKDPEITEILRRHERAGVPFYAIYPAGRPADVIVLPEIINKKLILESLEQAGPSRVGAGA
jgi:thiol:disulfide interchange protein DsbD